MFTNNDDFSSLRVISVLVWGKAKTVEIIGADVTIRKPKIAFGFLHPCQCPQIIMEPCCVSRNRIILLGCNAESEIYISKN